MEESINEAEKLTMNVDENGGIGIAQEWPHIGGATKVTPECGLSHPLNKEPQNIPTVKTVPKDETIDIIKHNGVVDMVMDQERDDAIMAATSQVKKAKVASDSGAVANVIHPDMLPDNVEFVPNTTGYHFVNAQGGVIEKFGSCKTLMKGSHGDVGCGWQAADVARALHSVSQTTGPVEKPRQDVLYNAARCVVVPPGVVDYIMKHLSIFPVMEYKRDGNLWIAEVELSSFTRRGLSP